MPTDTFFRLPAEKQRRLLAAAREEFSRVSLQEASIANIVRHADIPRGSFYQYFEDKEDLFYYYFDSLRQESKKGFEDYLKKEQGDLFLAFERYFDWVITEVVLGPDALFYKNLFMHMDFHGTKRVSTRFTREAEIIKLKSQQQDSSHQLLELIKTSNLELDSDKELRLLLQLITSILFTSLNDAYKQQSKGQEIALASLKKEFLTKLSWVKNGVSKEREGGNE